MAEGDRPPTFTQPVVDKDAKMVPVWYRFLSALARRLLAASQVETITTADIAASAVSVTGNYTAAGVAYAQADAATWVAGLTELKSDVNALIAELNTNRALVNELKAKLNELTAALNE